MTYLDVHEVLGPLLAEHKLKDAIHWCETELSKTSNQNDKLFINRNLNHLIGPLKEWIDKFYKRVSGNIEVKAMYCEMNGFTINPDLWFADLFAYDEYHGLSDLDWLGDWQGENATFRDSFIISGLDDLQKEYEKGGERNLLCDFLIILRFQELFKNALEKAQQENSPWANIPILVTAHDWEFIYQTKNGSA
ncbi:MAG TPA: hypothetical protein VL443_05295 [Cyclobacteriaceae bacterium]|jgi:hypothetical protein|nr:hypothetical protein [Cyclobacteriaceae bacterium]